MRVLCANVKAKHRKTAYQSMASAAEVEHVNESWVSITQPPRKSSKRFVIKVLTQTTVVVHAATSKINPEMEVGIWQNI